MQLILSELLEILTQLCTSANIDIKHDSTVVLARIICSAGHDHLKSNASAAKITNFITRLINSGGDYIFNIVSDLAYR